MSDSERAGGAFGRYHPSVLLVWFLSLILISMFSSHPLMLLMAFTGAVSYFAMISEKREFIKSLGFHIIFAAVIAITNPLFSHKGVTVLFYIEDNPVTFEALLYGINTALMITAVAYLCRCFSRVITSDRLMYLLGRKMPNISLVLSSSLRFLPLAGRKLDEIRSARMPEGIYPGKTAKEKIKNGSDVMSSLVTWSLESTVDTGSSMRARGYGLGKAGSFSMYRFRRTDAAAICIFLLLASLTVAGMISGKTAYSFYPEIKGTELDVFGIFAVSSFGIMAFYPSITEIRERIVWKYYVSKI